VRVEGWKGCAASLEGRVFGRGVWVVIGWYGEGLVVLCAVGEICCGRWERRRERGRGR
jgi:hypothetical protein